MNNLLLSPIRLDELEILIQNSVEKAFKSQNPPELPDSDRWFDLQELCNYLPDKPAKPTVYGWVASGLIPCHKGAKKLRFLKSDIDKWIKSGKKKTQAEIAEEAYKYTKNKKG